MLVIGLRCTTCNTSYRVNDEDHAPVKCPGCGYKTQADELGSIFFNSGNEMAAKGEFKNAIGAFTVAIRHNPRDKGAYNNRGLCHGSLGNHAHAILDYNEALRLDPNYSDAVFNRDLAYAGQIP